MKPFFSYYGSKYRLCQQGFYPAPKKGNVVIEPFAGSATYSVYHEPERAVLIDSDPAVVSVWEYLIAANEKDIANLPNFQDEIHTGYADYSLDVISEQYKLLDDGAKNLIGFWIGRAQTRPVKSLTSWFIEYHNKPSCMVWNEYVKERIIKQLPKIRRWLVLNGNYTVSDNIRNSEKITLFIDPPYSGKAGRKYKHNKINYHHLQCWLEKQNLSQVIACENEDLNYRWADFNQAAEASNNVRGKKYELVWLQG